jgi:hypothetical protein
VGERWLPVANFGSDGLCGGAGYVGEFRLHGAADDPRQAWMIGPDGRRELAWPVGFSARFTPMLQVLDERGRLVASEGALVTGGCPTDDAGVTYPDFSTPSHDGVQPRRLDPEPWQASIGARRTVSSAG